MKCYYAVARNIRKRQVKQDYLVDVTSIILGLEEYPTGEAIEQNALWVRNAVAPFGSKKGRLSPCSCEFRRLGRLWQNTAQSEPNQ